MSKEKIESGWVVEKGEANNPMYLSASNSVLYWDEDCLKAIRFARRIDAEMISEIVDDADRVAQHEWVTVSN